MSQTANEPPAGLWPDETAQPAAPAKQAVAAEDNDNSPFLRREFFSSEKIDEVAGALAKAQGEIENPGKNRINPHFKSQYADLAAYIEVSKKSLSRNGLSVLQLPTKNGNGMELRTILLHASGQYIGCTIPLLSLNKGPQLFGSELTYIRRYAQAGLLNLAAEDDDDDDDGNAAQVDDGRTPDNRGGRDGNGGNASSPAMKALQDKLANPSATRGVQPQQQPPRPSEEHREQQQRQTGAEAAAATFGKQAAVAIAGMATADDVSAYVGAEGERLQKLKKFKAYQSFLADLVKAPDIFDKIGGLQTAAAWLYDDIVQANAANSQDEPGRAA